ncbi:GNAT family N-acetyltransferase [Candidatus Protochlamydia phocaeensis]|uniref:GNAT family N-acetyltransferase n=1 Tax=Candidatus Protochlamydia phocaeensis TaxID=1414722 RepID=UPI0008391EA9|nr:GNAT family N-acetyltransferase [Candidatus Protochlamydia phocaeensis]
MDSPFSLPTLICLKTERLFLRTPQALDALPLTNFELRNQAYLRPWASSTGEDVFSLEAWQKKLCLWEQEQQQGLSLRFLFFQEQNPDFMIGSCHFTQIFRGAFQACYLGYKLDQHFQGQGLMFEALRASIGYVFTTLNLHRIMANYIPSNTRSAKLLDRLHFVIEGYAKNYLLIDGCWQDHVLASLTNVNWHP